jgi:HrpA-like RNA helicase
MAELPLDPQYASFLLNSVRYDCIGTTLSVIAMLNIENLFYFPEKRQNLVEKVFYFRNIFI